MDSFINTMYESPQKKLVWVGGAFKDNANNQLTDDAYFEQADVKTAELILGSFHYEKIVE